MIKLIDTIKNIFSIEELRDRIINTIGFLVIFRLGSFVVLPGIDPSKLQQSAGGIFGLLDTFLIYYSKLKSMYGITFIRRYNSC